MRRGTVALATVWALACTDDTTGADEIGDTDSSSEDSSDTDSSSEDASDTDSSSEESSDDESSSEDSSESESESEESSDDESESEESSDDESESESESEESSDDDSESEESSDCPPGTLDCPCDEGSCESPLLCADDICIPDGALCGDGNLDLGEDCDDGNLVDGDGCESNCVESPEALSVTAGTYHSCALSLDASVYCWGRFNEGRLGLPALEQDVGDDEEPSTLLQPLNLGAPALAVAAGGAHTCAVLEGGNLVCWGWAFSGVLGYGNTEVIGDDEDPVDAGLVDVGGAVESLAASHTTTCVILEGGALRCWGIGTSGKLGLGNEDKIGDDETPSSVDPVDLPEPVSFVSPGQEHTCAVTESGQLYCWGANTSGQLGLGHTQNIGDDESPSEGLVELGELVSQVAAGGSHTCALTQSGGVRCWGLGSDGQLGYGNTQTIGDEGDLSLLADVELGGVAATGVVAGQLHTCALLEDGDVRCWGSSDSGTLGLQDYQTVGDDETPAAFDPVEVDPIDMIASTRNHVCTVTQGGMVVCWGLNNYGRIGYPIWSVGLDQAPADVGAVSFIP
nr:hypothetical protein [Pseudenhygromyxa sp. WMMC2535]